MGFLRALPFLYLGAVNIVGFFIMGIDKKRAVRGAWRIPEATLFFCALLGGSLGSILGMRFFHHKTRHWYFVWGMPLILTAQILLGIWICKILSIY